VACTWHVRARARTCARKSVDARAQWRCGASFLYNEGAHAPRGRSFPGEANTGAPERARTSRARYVGAGVLSSTGGETHTTTP
jgi:hypothetical protein